MKSLLRIILIMTAGLSVFRLGSLLWNLELSQIMSKVVAHYAKLLKPIRVIFESVLQPFLEKFDWDFPEWSVHFFVIWVLIGGATVRCLEAVDRQTGQAEEGNVLLNGAASVVLALFGVFLFMRVLMEWWVRGLLLRQEGVDVREARGFSPYQLLAWEICLTLLSAVAYLAFNAFT